MKTFRILPGILASLCLAGCSKALDAVENKVAESVSQTPASGGVAFTIQPGAHYCDQSGIRAVDLAEQNFSVRFDSSAIYASADAGNQYDINKLWGFTDNNSTDPLQYSARFGWRWSDGALRLFGFVHNAGVFTEKELGTVTIGSEAQCRIAVKAGQYLFTLNGHTDSLRRAAITPRGTGYQLFPYFGGDEVAPHKVTIWIREQ